jgi:hypothetical protein
MKILEGDYVFLGGISENNLTKVRNIADKSGFKPVPLHGINTLHERVYNVICACVDGGGKKVLSMGHLSSKTLRNITGTIFK